MRLSAEIGSEKITRSTRVWRANSTRSSTVPSLGTPAQLAGLRSSPRSSNTPMMRTSESRCAASERISVSPLLSAPTTTVRRSSRPSRVQRRTRRNSAAAKRDQREQAEHVEAAEPGAGELVAGFGEERSADGDQKHHRPRRGEPHILLLVAAEGLDLIDVGGLERQHGEQRDADDGAEIVPGKAVSAAPRSRHRWRSRRRRPEPTSITRTSAGEHDRRIGALVALCGNSQRGGRKLRAAAAGAALRAASPTTAERTAEAVSKMCWVRAWTWLRDTFAAATGPRANAGRHSAAAKIVNKVQKLVMRIARLFALPAPRDRRQARLPPWRRAKTRCARAF